MSTITEVFVGLDIAQAHLDLALWADPQAWRFANDPAGHTALIEHLRPIAPVLIVVEATGGYERGVVHALQQAGWAVAVVNPRRVRDFARANGRLAKTDRLDAHNLAHFAQAVRPHARPVRSAAQEHLAALVARRRQILEMLKGEQNRLHQLPLALRPRLEAHLAWLTAERDSLDRELAAQLDGEPTWQAKAALLRSAPAVGPVTAATLLAEFPELGTLDRKRVAALAGLAPMNQDSGHKRGKRRTSGGRAPLRSTLYMATLTATRYNPVLEAFYQNLLRRGKEKKVALTACMRKFLTILNAMLRDNRPWQSQLVSA